MRKFLVIAAALAAIHAPAQIAEVSAPRPLLRGVQSNMYHPQLSSDGRYLKFTDDREDNARIYDFEDNVTVRLDDADAATRSAITPQSAVTARVEDSRLIIGINGHEQAYTPVEAYAGYLWPSVSPDRTKVMFVAAGKGIVITDLQGNIISRPGNRRLEAPAWFGNDYIVAMNSTDDGHQIESSQILLLSIDGSQSQALTSPESMTMFPTACLSTGKVIYNTIDGKLLQLDVKIVK